MKMRLLLLACLLPPLSSALAADVPAKAELAATLQDARINESSGLALGLRNPDVFWTVNDSGGGPFLFAFDDKGQTLARFEITGAANFDWEDIAAGRDASGKPCLFIGDIGDNLMCRARIEIYQIEEPQLDTAAEQPAERKVSEVTVLKAAYPDTCHNAESLLCHPQTGRLLIITKTDHGGCGVYALPEKLDAAAVMPMTKVTEFRLPQLARSGKRAIDNCMSTAASFSRDGGRIALSTYCSIYIWAVPPAESLAESLAAAFAKQPQRIAQPLTRQNEAVCFSPDGRHLWMTSEKAPAPLYKITAEK